MNFSTRKAEQIKKVMLDPEADIPHNTYYMLRNIPGLSKGSQRLDLTILPAIKLGQEFNKTFGHIHQGNEPETYKLLLGEALFLLQKFSLEGNKPGLKEFERPITVEKIKIIHPNRGEIVEIPSGWHHETINIGNLPLILVNWIPANTKNYYHLVEEMHGFGYYIIDNNEDGYELVENKNYTEVPEAELI